MIRFETINDQLCRMVEPEPLTDNTKYPCIMTRKYRSPSAMDYLNEYMVIGYPVADGSAEWALWQRHNKRSVITDTGVVMRYHYDDETCNALLRVYPTGWQLYEPEPAKEPIADCDNCKHVCTNSNIDYCHMYEPKPAYKVGDWIEYFDNAELCHAQIDEIDSDYCTINPVVGWDRTLQRIRITCITRKLKHSEVVVHIGCLNGTVEKASDFDLFLLWHSKKDCDYSMIRFDALDEPTHKLVNELLEKQEEK